MTSIVGLDYNPNVRLHVRVLLNHILNVSEVKVTIHSSPPATDHQLISINCKSY